MIRVFLLVMFLLLSGCSILHVKGSNQGEKPNG